MDIRTSKVFFLLTVLFIKSVSSGVNPSNSENENDSNTNGAQTVQNNGNTGSINVNEQFLTVQPLNNFGGPTALPTSPPMRSQPLMRHTTPQSSSNRFSRRPDASFNVNRHIPNRFSLFRMPNRPVRPAPPQPPNTTNRKKVHLSLDVVAGRLGLRGGSVSNLQKTHQTRPWSVSEALKFNVGRIPFEGTVSDVSNNQRAIKGTTRYPIQRMKVELPPPVVVGTSFKDKTSEFKHHTSESPGQVQTALFKTATRPENQKWSRVEISNSETTRKPVVKTFTSKSPTLHQSSFKNKTQTQPPTIKDYTTHPYPESTIEGKLIDHTNLPVVLSSFGSTTPSVLNADVTYSSNKPLFSTSLTSRPPADYFKRPKTTEVVEVYNHNVATNIMKPNFLAKLKPALVPDINEPKRATKAPGDKAMFGSESIATATSNKININVKNIKTHSSDNRVSFSPIGAPSSDNVIVYDVKFVNNELKSVTSKIQPHFGEIKVGPVKNILKHVTESDSKKTQKIKEKISKNDTKIQPLNENTDTINKNVNNMEGGNTSNTMHPVNTMDKIQPVKAIDKIQQVNAMDKIQQVNAMDKIHQVNAMDKIQPVNAMDKIHQVNAMDKIQQVYEMDKIQPVNAIDKIQQVNAMDKTQQVNAMDKTEQVNAMEKTQQVNAIDKTQQVTAIGKIQQMNAMDKMQQANAIDKVQPMDPTDTIQLVNTMQNLQLVNSRQTLQPVNAKETIDSNNTSNKILDKIPLKKEIIEPSINSPDKKHPIGFRIGTSKDIWTAMDTRSPIIGDIRSFQETALKQKGLDISPNILDGVTVKKMNLNLTTKITIKSTTPTTPPPTTHSPDAFKVKDFSLQKWIKGETSKMVLDVSKTSSKKSEHVTKFWTPTKEYLRALTEIEKRQRKIIMNQEALKNKLLKENLQKKQTNRISRAINTDVPINRVTTAWYEVPPLQPDVIPQFQDIPPISLDSVIGPSSGTNLGTKLSIKSSNSWNNLMIGSSNNNMPTWDTGPTTDATINSFPVDNKTTASIDSLVGTHSYSVNTIPPAGPNRVQNTADWNTGSNTATSSGKWEVKSSKSSSTWSIGPNTATNNQAHNAATAVPIVPSTDRWSQLPSTTVSTNTNWSGRSGSSSQWSSNNAASSATDSTSTWTTVPPSNAGTFRNSQWGQNTGSNSGTNSQWNQNTGSSSGTNTGSQWDNTNINSGIQSSQWDQSSGNGQQTLNQNINSNNNIQQGQWDQNTGGNTGSASTSWNQNAESASHWNVESNNVNQNTGTTSQWKTINTNTDTATQWNSGTNTASQNTGTPTQWNSGSNLGNENTSSGSQWNSGTSTTNQNTGGASQWNSGTNIATQNEGSGSVSQNQAKWNQNAGSNNGGASSNWNQNSEIGTQWNTESNVASQNAGSSSDTGWVSSSSSSMNFQNTGANPSWNQNTETGSSTSGSNWNQHPNGNTNWQQNTNQNSNTDLNSQWNNQAFSSNTNNNNNNAVSTVRNNNAQWNNAKTASNNGQWNEISSSSSVGSTNTPSNNGKWNQISSSSINSGNTISNNGQWNKILPPSSVGIANTGSNSGQWNQIPSSSSMGSGNTGSNSGQWNRISSSSSSIGSGNTGSNSGKWNQISSSSSSGSANMATNSAQWNQIKPSSQFGSSSLINQNRMSSISNINSGQSFNQQNQQPTNLAGTSSNWNHGSNTGNTQWNNGGQWNKGTTTNNVQSKPSPANDNVNVIKESGLLSGGVQTVSQGVVITKPEPSTPAPPPSPPPRQNQWGMQNNWRGGGPGQGWHSANQKGWVEIPQNNLPAVTGNVNNPSRVAGNINIPQTGSGNINNPKTAVGNMRPMYNNQVPPVNNWNPGASNQQTWQDNQWYPNNQHGSPKITATTTTTTTPKPTTHRPVRKQWVDRRTRWERMRERQYQMEMRRRRVYQRRLNRQLAVGDVPEGLSSVVQLNNFVSSLGGRLNPRDAAMAVMIDLT